MSRINILVNLHLSSVSILMNLNLSRVNIFLSRAKLSCIVADIDECKDDPCEENEICMNTEGGFLCFHILTRQIRGRPAMQNGKANTKASFFEIPLDLF